MMEKIGLIGFGSIGKEIYKKISKQFSKDYKVVGIFSDDLDKNKIINNLKCLTFEDLIKKKPNIIIEAAGVEACKDYAEEILKKKIDFICLSVCAFANKIFMKKIKTLSKKKKNKIYIPTGAIAGLDAIESAALCNEINSVELIQRKPPKALFSDKKLINIKKKKLLSKQTARTICTQFPKNSNIAATLSICGIGFDKTKVMVFADPKIKRNIAEIVASGSFGKLNLTLENNQSSNPKTSRLTAMSILKCLRKRKEHFLCPF